MTKENILEKIEKGETSIDKIEKWLKCLPSEAKSQQPTRVNKGDILFDYKINRPVVVLRIIDNCDKQTGLVTYLTTETGYRNATLKCRSRFFHDSKFINSIAISSNLQDMKHIGIYDNNRHLTEVRKYLINRMIEAQYK